MAFKLINKVLRRREQRLEEFQQAGLGHLVTEPGNEDFLLGASVVFFVPLSALFVLF